MFCGKLELRPTSNPEIILCHLKKKCSIRTNTTPAEVVSMISMLALDLQNNNKYWVLKGKSHY